uniref:Chitin-binding type-2 domain-containing protein n=1 Tax=Anopheles dirus TaxID=7168 RepID=A0A182NEY0_9DIPT
MAQNRVIVVLIVVLQVVLGSGQQLIEEGCPTATRPHMTRCDQYYRCTVLSKDAHVWVATQCQKGLVYMHNLGTCVVPDSDWECDISSEKELNHSDENVYGIDNLHVPATSSSQAGSEEHSQELPISATSGVDRTKADGGSSSALDQNDIEYSGDGSLERLSDELSTAPTHIKAPTVDPSKSPLSATQLDSFLAYYDTQNALKLKGKLPPPKMTETSYLARLKQIVSQQKELNEMTKIPTNENIFTYKAIPVEQLAGGKQQENATEAPPLSDLNLSPGMQEIIKSILDISQKAIANQKPPPAPAPAPEVKDPVVKPIFIPISLHPAPVADVAPAVPVAIPTTTTTTTTEQPAKATFSPTQPSVPSANELKFGQNSLRGPEGNNAIYHEYHRQVLYDAYGNKFIPKDAYQAVPPNYPVYNPYLSPVQPGAFYGQAPSLSRPGDGVSYFQDYRYSPLRINAPVNEFADADRVKTLETIDSFESDDVSSLEKDLPLPLEKHGEDSDDEGFDEDSPTGSDTAHTKYKRKLFTLGDSTFDYEQYKDSMLPLINANPDDDRISVVLCMVGSRQPNSTDCFKYYICNPHNGMFQSYTCPPLTAFNKKSRMCDLTTYKHCAKVMNPPAAPRQQLRTRKQPAVTQPSTNQIREIKNELRKAQKYVEMIRLEASKLKHHSAPPQPDQKVIFLPSMGAPAPGATKRAPQEQAPAKKTKRKNSSVATKQSQPQRKVPRCRLEGRMPDPMDQSNYYVCHRKSPNKFIKMKMACPLNLSYCPDTQYCTLNGNC